MVNKVILIGNVGIDPEIRTTEGGVKVARIRLATTERLFDRQANEAKEHTEWHTITLWRGLADVVDKYVRKGTQIYVEGRLRTREWMDKDNNKRYTTEILADVMNLLGRPAVLIRTPCHSDPDDLPFLKYENKTSRLRRDRGFVLSASS